MFCTASRAALVSAALLLSPLALPAGAADDSAVTGVLTGGGGYIVRPVGGPPVAAVALWYRAPSAGFDADPAPGIARLAAATVAASPPVTGTSLAQFVTQVGGRLAVTAYPESVAISALVPSDQAAATVQAMTRSYFAPVVEDAGLTVAKGDLVNAAQIRAFTPDMAISDALYGVLFAGGPAKTPTLGSPQDVRALTLDRVRAYAERAFRPTNAYLVVTGDVTPDIVGSALAGREGAAAGQETPQPESLAPAGDPHAIDGAEPGFGLAWAGPPIADERAATAFDFIADYLFYPDSGTVTHALDPTGTTVTGTFVTFHDPGVFVITASGGDLKAARAAIDDGLAGIRRPLDRAAFENARRAFIYHILSDEQTAGELADTYGWYNVEGNPKYAPGEGGNAGAYLAAAAALTPEYVAATAARILDRPPAAVNVTPKKAQP
jgi:predicted Zn-dependent peptidase